MLSCPLPSDASISASDLPDWPEDFIRRYQEKGYWQDQTFTQALAVQAQATPQRIAVTENGRHYRYVELLMRIQQLAVGLRRLGLEPGDNAIVHLPNSIQFIEVCFALFQLGVRPILALPAHREHEIKGFCQQASAKAYIAQDDIDGFACGLLGSKLLAAHPSLQRVIIAGTAGAHTPLASLYDASVFSDYLPAAHDVACFQLSGGTTGTPKLIPRRHDEYLYNVRACMAASAFDAQTVYLTCLPMAHNFTLCCPGLIGTLLAGGRVVVTSRSDPDTCFALIEAERITHVALVPPLVMLWLDAQAARHANLSSLRLLQAGGARLMSHAAERVRPIFGCELQQVLGMAEGLICCTRPGDSDSLLWHTQGRPVSQDDEIRIVDEQGSLVPDGVTGELQARGPYTIRGYYRLSEHNANAFTADGFYRTGDRVHRTADGYIVVEGRDKDQINRGGEKISAEEVENLLIAHPQVQDAAVVASPDPVLGERIHAFVVPRTPAPTSLTLKRYLHERGLAAFKVPDRIEFLDQFPETGIGKISKKSLRDRLARLLCMRHT